MEQMKTVLDDDAFDFRFELGITQQPSTLSDRDCIVQFFAKHFTVVRVKAQLDQMIDGLKALGIYDLIKANPRSMHKLFTSKPAPITSDVINLFQMRFSPEGSNRREDEEQVVMFWVHFLEMIECKSNYIIKCSIHY